MSDFLGPKPQTQAGLDTAVAAKINDTGSAARGALDATYATVAVVQKIDSAGTHTAATFAVRLDANGDVDALVLNGVDL